MTSKLPVGLIGCLVVAVLAFGGMEQLYFAAVEVGVFLLFGVLLWSRARSSSIPCLPWKGPALVLAFLMLQLLVIGRADFLRQEALLRIGTYLCVFVLASCVSRHRRCWVVYALIALGLFEALYGLAQHLSGWQQIFTYKKVFYTDRASGTYINPNHFAGFLEMVLPLCLAWTLYRLNRFRFAGAQARGGSGRTSGGERVAPLIFFFFASLLLFGGILFSQSRMGIFAACGAVAAMAVLWLSTSWRRSTSVLALVAFLGGASLLGLWIGLDPVAERFEGTEGAYLARLEIWKDTVALIKAHPLFGTGSGSFVDVYPRVQTTFLTKVVDHAHNDYLEISAEWGLAGAALLLGLILTVLRRGLLAFRREPHGSEGLLALGCCGSVLAILIHSVADFNLQIPANAMVFAVILGLLYSISTEGDASRRA